MRLQPLLISPAQALHAVGDPAVAAGGAQELGAPLVGQRLLGGIEDLHQMADGAVGGERLDVLARLRDRIEEIAEQKRAGEARQMRLGRLGRGERRLVLMREDRLGDVRGGLAARGRVREPEEGDALGPAHEQLCRRQHEHQRALALGRGGEVAAEIHGGGQVRPQPNRVRRLPFALAHVKMVRARRAPPVDLARGVALAELAELPERLARARAAAAVDAVRDRLRDALGLDQDVRQPVGEAMRLAFQGQDAGRLPRLPTRLRGGIRHSCSTPLLLRAGR